MTIIIDELIKCGICGAEVSVGKLASTNAFGSSDLDTRPPGRERGTIDYWVQRCNSCGYCTPDISKSSSENLKVLISSKGYKEQLNNPNYSELANSFLCWSIIKEDSGDFAGAGWASIHAAWVCDDNNIISGARECRKRAVELLEKAQKNGQIFGEGEGAEEALMVDLLRRSSQFDKALKICNEKVETTFLEKLKGTFIKKKPLKLISQILQFQKILISNSDTACYTIEEAIKKE